MSAPRVTCDFIVSNSAGVSLPGLFRMCSGMRELAGIVQQRRGLDRLQRRRVGDVQRAGEAHRVRLDAVDVIARDAVFGFDGGGQRRHRRQVQLIDSGDVPLGVVDPAKR